MSSQAQSSTRTQPPCKPKGAKPSGGKSRGIPELPSNAPPLNSSVKAWREFINKEQRHPHWGKDSKFTLMAMLPGVLETSSRPDDSDTEADPPSLCNIQGFLLYECLAPSLLNWGEVSPVKGTSHPWDTGQEYVNSIIANGGENNPQVMAKIEPLRKALTEPCPPSNVRSREWYKRQAQAIGCTINQCSSMTSPTVLVGGVSTVRGNPPAKDSEPEEGEMTDDLFKDEDRS
ncbi:hypothetical protein BKA82DRAFT_4015644 [Pisolithus tinctorius]|nr:hypothetical protein BKA82DRAFT_4015644 [Pisolithus tinctorius]